jgi:hypothetical protein
MSKDLFLALKIEVDCAFADLGAGGDIVYGGAVESALKELASGSVEDFPTTLRLFSCSSLCGCQVPLSFVVEKELAVTH